MFWGVNLVDLSLQHVWRKGYLCKICPSAYFFAWVWLKQLQHFKVVIALDVFFQVICVALYHAKSPVIDHLGWFTNDLLYGMILEVL